MKTPGLFAILAALLVCSCGPSESELRSELTAVEGELVAIQIAMRQHSSAMSQAEAEAFFGSFATGYGVTSGDYGMAGEGALVASDAIRQYDVSSYSLDQLRTRYLALGKRRMEILHQLD